MLAVQLKMARAAADLTTGKLAELAGVSQDALLGIEAGEPQDPSTLAKVRATLEAAGLEFIDGDQPGVRVKLTDAADHGLPVDQLNAENDG